LTEVYRDEAVALIVVTHSHELAHRFGAQMHLEDGTLVRS
jgi:predicted ABC-type transport system involved in lysophospholipase L1 biosynthesis ATPase subunit